MLVAVGFGSSETIEKLDDYRRQHDLPWTFAEGPDRMVRDFDVTTQGTKIGISGDGTIAFHNSRMGEDEAYWRGALRDLSGEG